MAGSAAGEATRGMAVEIDGHRIEVSNRDKVLFPDAGLTKGDLIDYYDRVAPTMLGHLKRHVVAMERFPDGIDEKGFFQREVGSHFPDWIATVRVPRRDGGSFCAPLVESRAALAYLANQAMVTPHLYLAPAEALDHPDRLIFDLDPPEGDEEAGPVRRAARELRELLAALSLQAWIQTTGSRGFHLVVPLDGSADFDRVRRFAHDVARVLVRRHPSRYTLEQRKDKRGDRLYLDVMRNAYGASAVAPYAVRARPGAPVATPLCWDELERATPRRWTLRSMPRRLAQKPDPWADLARHAYRLAAHRSELDELLAQS